MPPKRRSNTEMSTGYETLLSSVTELLRRGRQNAAKSVDAILTTTYWLVGRRLVEFEQRGKERAVYGSKLLKRLSGDLQSRFGRGFSERNLEQMRQFYLQWENTHVIVEDLFLTSTAALADLVLPSSSPYEKSGTFTNTCGDLQVIRKAADCMGPRSDLEIILQLAERMGADVAAYRGNGPGVRGEFGESRRAQCGEADPQAVWMSAQGANLRITSFDPDSVRREIQNLLPDYRAPHVSFSHDIPRTASAGETVQATALIKPYGDDLFSSEAFGRYSANLNSVLERNLTLPYESEIEPE